MTYPPATVATRKRAAGRRLLKVANSLPVKKEELLEGGDAQFLDAKDLEAIDKLHEHMEKVRTAMTRMGARLAATE